MSDDYFEKIAPRQCSNCGFDYGAKSIDGLYPDEKLYELKAWWETKKYNRPSKHNLATFGVLCPQCKKFSPEFSNAYLSKGAKYALKKLACNIPEFRLMIGVLIAAIIGSFFFVQGNVWIAVAFGGAALLAGVNLVRMGIETVKVLGKVNKLSEDSASSILITTVQEAGNNIHSSFRPDPACRIHLSIGEKIDGPVSKKKNPVLEKIGGILSGVFAVVFVGILILGFVTGALGVGESEFLLGIGKMLLIALGVVLATLFFFFMLALFSGFGGDGD